MRRAADIAHLALAYEVREGAQGLLDRHEGRRPVQLVEIDIVDLQPSQGRVAGLEEQQQRPGALLGKIAEELGLITDDQLAQALAEQLNMQTKMTLQYY